MSYLEYCQLMGRTAEAIRQADRAAKRAKEVEAKCSDMLEILASVRGLTFRRLGDLQCITPHPTNAQKPS